MTGQKSVTIGLTGGPGTGKTLAAMYMKENGAIVISGDKAGRKAVQSASVCKKLVDSFGKSIMNSQGELDRKTLARRVFADFKELEKLNEIVHPALLRILKEEVTQCKRKNRRVVVVDAALIYEWGIANWFDFMVVVRARRSLRIARMMRAGLTRQEAMDRIRSQMPDRIKASLADYVIKNDGTRKSLRRDVKRFLKLVAA